MKSYSLENFTPEEIELAKEFVYKAMFGLFTIKGRDIVDGQFQVLKGCSFTQEDKLHFCFTVVTIGNDVIAALGAARNEIEGKLL